MSELNIKTIHNLGYTMARVNDLVSMFHEFYLQHYV